MPHPGRKEKRMKKIIQAIARFFRRLFRIKPRFTARYADSVAHTTPVPETMPILKNAPGGHHVTYFDSRIGRVVRRPGRIA